MIGQADNSDHSSSPSPNSPSTTSLPVEVIYVIISHLDPPTACAFARAARTFTRVAEVQIWRRLTLQLPHSSKEQSCGSKKKGAAERDEEERIARERENAHGVELRARVKGIVMWGSGRHWRNVREVVMTPRSGSIQGMIQVLDLVSENVKSLEIRGVCGQHSPVRDIRPTDHETIDVLMINSGITFNALTHLRLLDEPLRFFEFVPLICNAAPNLLSLIADLEHDPHTEMSADDLNPSFQPFARPTRIKTLRINAREDEDEQGLVQYIIDILRHCPCLQEAAINWEGTQEEQIRIRRVLGAMAKLEDLVWMIGGKGLEEVITGGLNHMTDPLQSVRRLVIQNGIKPPLESVPELPRIEVLVYVDFSGPHIGNPSSSTPATRTFTPLLARQLRSSSQLAELRCFHPGENNHSYNPTKIDDLDVFISSTYLAGEISSYRHLDEEALHARFLEQSVETSVIQEVPERYRDESWYPLSFAYAAEDGTQWIKTFEVLEDRAVEEKVTVWQDYTDYAGRVIPLEVLSRMREAQGASEEEWTGRGIEVGDAAWEVLLEWKRSVVVEEV